MSDIHALSGAYAVDALDDAERAQFEDHLAECDTCRAEVESLQETAALLAETTIATPSADLRDRVLSGIASVRPLPPVVPPVEPPVERPAAPAAATEDDATVVPLAPRRRRRVVTFLAAAAAVVAIGTGAVVSQLDDEPPSAIDRVIQADDAQRFTQTFPGGATATVVRSEDLNEAVVITHDMPAAPSGHTYALWLQHDDVMVPAGVMPEGPDNEVLLSGDAATADGAGITVEVAGQEPTVPSDDVVAVISFDA
ncbi:anti-sigma factor [Nocardioides halotolerans]|uniref:anti-sigma factor n=1 Tax=Nocardioides halotolerans TaxID=433660 RepID=UPI00041B071B|nr:anti-sigma factor [Nocardioides halotolerans]